MPFIFVFFKYTLYCYPPPPPLFSVFMSPDVLFSLLCIPSPLCAVIGPAELLVGCRASGVSALSLQPSRLCFSALRCRGPLHLSPRFCGQALWLASAGLREAGDAEARGARSHGVRTAEMGGFLPHWGLSPGGVQAPDRGNTRCMWLPVVCFQ